MKISAVQTFTLSVLLLAVCATTTSASTKLRGATSFAIDYEETDPLDAEVIIIQDDEEHRDLQDNGADVLFISVTNATEANMTETTTVISGAQEATGGAGEGSSDDSKDNKKDKGKSDKSDDEDDETQISAAQEADMGDPEGAGGTEGSVAGAAPCPAGSFAIIATESGEVFCTSPGGGDDRRA